MTSISATMTGISAHLVFRCDSDGREFSTLEEARVWQTQKEREALDAKERRQEMIAKRDALRKVDGICNCKGGYDFDCPVHRCTCELKNLYPEWKREACLRHPGNNMGCFHCNYTDCEANCSTP